MADDQVKYSDLIAQDVQPGLTMLAEALKAVAEQIAALKTEATALKGAMSAAGTATREQQQATAQQAASVEGLSKKVKQLTEEERRLEDVRKRYKKLTDEQIERVNAFQQALRGSTQQQMAAVNAIEIEKKSYNELNAIYNTLKDSLNAMTVAERQNTEAGKAMTMQANNIRNTMNELQKATGNYTLQVGKYRAAFDGLGYSFQQILREAPSALNIQQFFLAISNNIPMFTDQLKAFRDEQKEIKANLATMTEGTKEYAEQLGKVESVGKKLTKTLFSWQSLVLVGLLALRNLEKIKGWLDKIFNSMGNILSREKVLQQRISDLSITAMKAYKDEETELGLIIDNLRGVVQGTEEWKLGIERVNEITKSNLSTTHATISEVEAVTDAYLEQMRVLAMNKQLVETLSGNDVNVETIGKAYAGKLSGSAAAKQLGLTGDDAEDFAEAVDEYVRAMNFRDAMAKRFKKFALNPNYNIDDIKKFDPNTYKARKATLDDAQKAMDDAWTAVEDLVSEYKLLLDPRDIDTLREMYKNGGRKPKVPKTPREHTYSLKDVDFLESELLDKDAVIELETSFKRRLAMLDEEEEKERLVLKEKYEHELKDLKFNKEKKLITEKEYEEQRARLDANYNDLIKTNYEGNFEEMGVIQRKYWNKRNELAFKEAERQEKEEEKRLKKEEQEAKDAAKTQYDNLKQKWQEERALLVERGAKKKELIGAEIDAEIARLQTMLTVQRSLNGEIMTDEEKQKINEWISLLKKLKESGDFGNMKPGQIFGKGGSNVSNERKRYSSVVEILFPEMDNNQISDINAVFDQAKSALNSWMDARKAAADQAKELADDEVAAAENALNREIELRNQGYANDVALREKELADAKEMQRKAAEEQEKLAKEQILLDAALQTSSMITASANIFKDFPLYAAIPMLAVMWGSFAAAKIKAYQASTKSIKFKEGGVMLLDGGSHESGHDVNLGIGPDGSNLRAEGGEYFAVINKRSSRKYGSQIPAVVNALNSGMFEDRYIKTSDAIGMLPQVIRADDGTMVDLSRVESGVSELVKQGESRWTVEGEYRVMRYKNLTRRVRVS